MSYSLSNLVDPRRAFDAGDDPILDFLTHVYKLHTCLYRQRGTSISGRAAGASALLNLRRSFQSAVDATEVASGCSKKE